MKIKKGFTLIELLVVIAIIALLLAIIVPSLKKAKEYARFIMCKSNLKSYGVMAFSYTTDNGEVMPNSWTSFYNQWQYPEEESGEFHRYCRWHNPYYDLTVGDNGIEYGGPFWQYLAAKDIHICPTFPQFAQLYGDQHPEHRPTIPIEPNYNYSMNVYLSERKTGEFKLPGEVFFFGEENVWLHPDYNDYYAFNDTAFAYSMGDWFGSFHNIKGGDRESGVVNAVFLDGHTQTVNRDETPKYAVPQGEER